MAVFAPGEVVLAFHGPLLYEGKILSSELRTDAAGDETMLYLNHYKGWNRSWDEWLPADRIKKMDAANLELQKSLIERMSKGKKTGKRAHGGGPDGKHKTSSEPSKKRRGEQPGPGEAPNALRMIELKLVIPDEVKLLLVEDWYHVVPQKKVVSLPQSSTISDILADYVSMVQGEKAKGVATEVASGLKLYFEHGCGSMLLYKQERPQFDELISEDENVRLCEMYGVAHLLRLFIKLPSMMQSAGVGPKGMVYLVKCFQDILQFVKANHLPDSVADSYQECSASYMEKAKKA